VSRIVYLSIIGSAAAAVAVSMVCWYLASIYGTSARRGRSLFAASLFGGAGICAATLALIVYQRQLPVFEAEGSIEAVSIHRDRHERTDVLIHTFSGGDIALRAFGSSHYFRRDEHVKVRYHGETGTILRVVFVSTDGREEGVFNDIGVWPLFFFLLLGIMIILQGFRRHRRDPEGVEEPSARNQHPYGAVDEGSLLNLSKEDNSESEPDFPQDRQK
jgi:hypothetical protein